MRDVQATCAPKENNKQVEEHFGEKTNKRMSILTMAKEEGLKKYSVSIFVQQSFVLNESFVEFYDIFLSIYSQCSNCILYLCYCKLL